MADLKKFLSRIRLVYRPSQTATKIMIILVLVLSMGALVALRISTNKLKQENEVLHTQAADLTAENDELKEDIDLIGSAEGAVEYAQDELGYVDPDTIIYEPES